MFGFKDRSVQRIAALVAISPIFEAMADFLAAELVWDVAYEMMCEERVRIERSARIAGVEVGCPYSRRNDADNNAERITHALLAHYCYPAMTRLSLARQALHKVVDNDATVYNWELSARDIVRSVLPERDDLIHIFPVRVE